MYTNYLTCFDIIIPGFMQVILYLVTFLMLQSKINFNANAVKNECFKSVSAWFTQGSNLPLI